MTKADLAREAVEKFPNTSKKAIAAYLYKHNPLMFNDQEDARRFVRAITGTSGGKKAGYGRIAPTHKDIYKGLPKGEKNDFSPFVLKPGSYGVISDLHVPYHDLFAIELAIEQFLKKGIKNLIINGDAIDAHHLSHWERDPSKRKFKEEANLLRGFLKELVKEFSITLKLGNHCERFEKFIMQKGPELYGMELMTFEAMLSIEATYDEEGRIAKVFTNNLLDRVKVVKNKRPIKAGKLNILHAHELPKGLASPVNPARGFFLRAKASVLGGHHHQTSEHIASDINEKITGCWSTGCLCDMHPNFMPINSWNLGFAEVHHDGDEFEVGNYKIINGKAR